MQWPAARRLPRASKRQRVRRRSTLLSPTSTKVLLISDHLGATRCLILDVRMHGMNGFDLQRQLRQISSEIPIIFITAHGNEAARSQALKDGAMDYLCKPFSDEALLNAIAAALSH